MTKRRPTTLYLVLALYLGLLASSARAGGVVGNGSPASCTDAALATALIGGGLVTFNCGPGNIVIPINTNVIFTGDSATVDGGNRVTLDGEGLRQHFYVLNEASLHLRRIALQNGRANLGGAVLNQGSLVVENVELTSNVAELFGSGGAIYNDSNSQLTVQGSTFRSNFAQAGGGAIQNLGILSRSRPRASSSTARASTAGRSRTTAATRRSTARHSSSISPPTARASSSTGVRFGFDVRRCSATMRAGRAVAFAICRAR